MGDNDNKLSSNLLVYDNIPLPNESEPPSPNFRN